MKKIWKLLLAFSIVLASMTAVSTVSAAVLDTLTFSIEQDYGKSQEVLKLINKERKKRGLNALTMDKTLTKYAITRAAELCVVVPWRSPHKRPNGSLSRSYGTVVYECCQERKSDCHEVAAEQVVDAYMSSPPHKAGILLASARSVGISFVSANDGLYGHYVLEFSNHQAKSKERSKKKKTMNVKVKTLRKFLPKKAFILEARETYSVTEKKQGIFICPFVETTENIGKYAVSPKDFTYKSNNKAIATISKSGTIKPVAPGKCTFTVTLKTNPKMKKKVSYTVTETDIERYGG